VTTGGTSAQPRRSTRWLVASTLFGLVAGACSADDGASTVATTAPVIVTTTAPPTTTSTTAPATTVPAPTTVPDTTAPPAPLTNWTPAEMPSEAFPACCGSNLIGSPSPVFPADPNGELSSGLYFAAQLAGDVGTDRVSMSVSPFDYCDLLGDTSCEPGWLPDDVGVVPDIARVVELPLDADVQVVVAGWDPTTCAVAVEEADGTQMRRMMTDFDRNYDLVLGDPFRFGESPDTLVAALSEVPTAGFTTAGCTEVFGPGPLLWDQGDGPGVLMQQVFPGSELTGFEPAAPDSASATWLRLTAARLDEDGWTLYFYAGFSS
jgi:hypothetical protein